MEVGRALARERDAGAPARHHRRRRHPSVHADGGALYRVNEPATQSCRSTIVHNGRCAGAADGSDRGAAGGAAPARRRQANHEAVVAHAALTRQMRAHRRCLCGRWLRFRRRQAVRRAVRVPYAVAARRADAGSSRRADRRAPARQRAGRAREASPNSSEDDQRLAEALTGLAGVVLSNQLLIGQLEALFRVWSCSSTPRSTRSRRIQAGTASACRSSR